MKKNRRYRQFIANYNRYVVFFPEGKENAVTRRLYKNSDGTYYFTFNNEKVTVTEGQLYW